MSLKPKKGRVAVSILGVYTPAHGVKFFLFHLKGGSRRVSDFISLLSRSPLNRENRENGHKILLKHMENTGNFMCSKALLYYALFHWRFLFFLVFFLAFLIPTCWYKKCKNNFFWRFFWRFGTFEVTKTQTECIV